MDEQKQYPEANPQLVRYWEACVRRVIAEAEAQGVSITVEQKPRLPLAMGNKFTVVKGSLRTQAEINWEAAWQIER